MKWNTDQITSMQHCSYSLQSKKLNLVEKKTIKLTNCKKLKLLKNKDIIKIYKFWMFRNQSIDLLQQIVTLTKYETNKNLLCFYYNWELFIYIKN